MKEKLMKKAYFSILGRQGFLTSPGQSVQVLLKSIITLVILLLLTFGPQTTFAQEIPSTILEGHTFGVLSVSFSPDGTLLASGSWDNTIKLWEVDTGDELRTLTGHTGGVNSVVFSPDGTLLASGSRDNTIKLWEVDTGDELRTLTRHTGWVSSVSFSPDGTLLASGSRDNTIKLWEVDTGDELRTLTRHTGWVSSVSFSPDGTMLASGSRDNTIKLWEVDTGDELRTLTGHSDDVNSVVFSPDGTLLASGSWDNTIKLWEVDTGDELRILIGHTGWVSSVSFSPDGTMLASGSRDNTIGLWSIATGKELHTLTGHALTGHEGNVYSIAFSPNGQTLAIGSGDSKIGLRALSDLPPPRTFISIITLPVDAPAIGDKLTLEIDITSGKNIKGYQAKINFDDTALRYVESANGNFLPADAFFVPPVVNGDQVTIGATSVTDDSSGDGTLATVTFEVIAIKESTLTLSKIVIVNSIGDRLRFYSGNRKSVVGVPQLREDVNLDGVVDILDLTLVAASFGQDAFLQVTPEIPRGDVNKDGVVDIKDLIELTILNAALVNEYALGYIADTVELYYSDIGNILADAWNSDGTTDVRNPADVNKDGVIDIIDLVLVAGALGNKAAAPSVYAQARRLFTAADVKLWLSQAQHLSLTDAQAQRGILFLQQLLAAFTPKKTALLPNYPNPFNPETWIPYQLAKSADVKISIYAADGKLIRMLDLEHQPIGIYKGKSRAAYWDGKNKLGEPVASGVYFYTLTAGDFTATRKMLIRK